MIRTRKSQVNRCFGKSLQKPKKSGEPKALPLTEEQKEEKKKRALLRKKADRALKDVRGRDSLVQILRLLEYRFPFLLKRAIERVEGQKSRNELKIEEIVFFEQFKESLKHPEQKG